MKVKSLNIESFLQIQNLQLDFTYPSDHPDETKRGKPLEKICFISQSGVGKSRILEFIAGMTHYYDLFVNKYKGLFNPRLKNYVEIVNDNISYKQYFRDTQEPGYETDDNKINNLPITDFAEFNELDKKLIAQIKPNLIYIPAEQKFTLGNDLSDIKVKVKTETLFEKFRKEEILDFGNINLNYFWDYVLQEVKIYHETYLQLYNEIESLRHKDDLNDLHKELKIVFEKLNEHVKKSPLKKLGNECLNKILSNFKIKLDDSDNFKFNTSDDIGKLKFTSTITDLPIENYRYDLLSTGIKQIISCIVPLYYLKPNKSIILIDEPERSLFPDIQKDIIHYYSNFLTDCQLFVATHSPIIASSFEPWELFHLEFDEENKIVQRLFYRGERLVKNYFYYPEYLSYNSSLKYVFNTKENNPKRAKLINDAKEYQRQIENINLSKEEKKQIAKELEIISAKLDWNFNEN